MFELPRMLSINLALLALVAPALSKPAARTRDYGHWQGFSTIENLFVFGTSYDATTQPFVGFRASNGPNWVDYITTIFNQSALTPYNYAYPGAVTDDLTPTFLIPTIQQQVELEFIPQWQGIFSQNPAYSDNSLFVLFASPVNDILQPAQRNTTDIPLDGIFADWKQMLDDLYKTGARNFVFNNLPNLNKVPVVIESDAAVQQGVAQSTAGWNQRLSSLASSARAEYPDITIFEPDMFTLFTQASENPGSFPETAGVTNTTGWCEWYQLGTPSPTTFYPACGIPVDQYLYLNSVHPQSALHKLIAHTMADTLEK